MFKRIVIIVASVIVLTPAVFNLLGPGYFNMHDDLQVMRLFEMGKCFNDGQIPCRWVPDMAWGYGQPMFNFYSAFPYYFGYVLKILFSLSFMGTVKLMFIASFVIAFIGMYKLVSNMWGRFAGFFAAVLYTYAPYHSLDIYVRGAMSESFALALLPFVFFYLKRLIEKSNYTNFALASIFLAFLFATHNISTMMYAPITGLWVLYHVISEKKIKVLVPVFLSVVFGIGLSAFFIIPVFVEKGLIQSQFLTMDYLDYNAHFVTIKQLFFDRSWGHGASIWGPNDEISFQIGWPHWLLAILAGFLASIRLVQSKFKESKRYVLPIGIVGLGFLSALMTHSKSVPLWTAFPLLSFVQFPWRFLGPVIFFFSLAGGYLFTYKFRFRYLTIFFLTLLVIILNVGYFVAYNRSYTYSDKEKLSGLAFELQQKSAILDYLPKTAGVAPKEKAFEIPRVKEGEGWASNFSKRSNSYFFDAEVYSDTAKFEVPVMYFPGWIVTSGGKIIESQPNGYYGLVSFSLPRGKHIIQGRFENTPVRAYSNALTLVSWGLLLLGFIYTSKLHDKEKV